MKGIVLFILCIIAPSLSMSAPYFLEQMTAVPEVARSTDKVSVAHNVVARVRKLCGGQLTSSRDGAPESVRLHFLRLKKVGGGSRFLLGPFRGNSVITIEVSVLDKAGKEVRRRVVNRRGNWFLGSVTVGATDNHMLTNVASDVCTALGGVSPSSAQEVEPEAVAIDIPATR